MHSRQRGESLSERLRSEVQVSAALWQIGPSLDENTASGDAKDSASRRASPDANVANTGASGFPCPREVKPLLFFYKYLQPIGGVEGVNSTNDNDNKSSSTSNITSQRKLRVNLPLTVVCERTNAQELVLWLRTDAQGHVVRDEKTPLWRKKLHTKLVGAAQGYNAKSPPDSHENDPILAVRSVARWKSSNACSGGSAVVLTRRTLDPVLAVPCELPTCIQQFVHCRGSQASVYRIFWCAQERKCFAVNLTSSLKNTEVPEDIETRDHSSVPTTSSGFSASTMAAMNAAFEAAMATAAETARFYCVTVSPDARACARWPKLRGAAIAEGVQATSRVVEHVQLQLPTLCFHSMTVDFIKDTNGAWWLTRVIEFTASSSVAPTRDDGCFSSRDSAVLISETFRTKDGRAIKEAQVNDLDSPPRESTLLRGDELHNALNSRVCFLCGGSCELTPTFRSQLEAMLKDQNGDEYKEPRTISMEAPALDEFRMTFTMALDTIFLMRQRGVSLSVWENAVSTVRKSQLRDVVDFPTCTLCYRIYQQQNRLQQLARELHNVLSPSVANSSDRSEADAGTTNNSVTEGVGMATSAASGLAASQLLSTELRYRHEAPKSVLDALEAFRTETIPPSLLLRGDSPKMRPTWSTLTPTCGANVDPTATQLRLVFFFHELQDGGPNLIPTDFYLEYQLGQNVTRVQLEGSKRHTPNRWQLCEARVHYLCATLDAFSEFCAHKRLLIKMKAKRPPRNDDTINSTSNLQTPGTIGDDEDEQLNGFGHHSSSTGNSNRYRDKGEFFGYTLLPLRAVNTAAKCFGNSLQPESRTDYLLELHTDSYGLLTLKLTVGLLVDPVPLGHLRDVLRDRVFLEEQPPCGVYWPPPSHCLGGLAVPRDWVGALMPSEYTKLLPMRRRDARGAPSGHALIASQSPSLTHAVPITLLSKTRPITRRNSADLVEATAAVPQSASGNNEADTARELPSTGASHVLTDQVQVESRSQPLHLMNLAMTKTTLSRVCLAAKRIVFRVTEDATTRSFPTILLAALLRHANFASSSCFPSSTWKYPARFQFTQRYSVDRLLTEMKPENLPMLALLGELLLVLLEDREVPATLDASALESLLEPYWQQDSEWRPIARTRSSCLPERRVIWNRAIRRWEAASCDASWSNKTLQVADGIMKSIVEPYRIALTTDIGAFRTKRLALVLCELFELMETLDNGYIEIAELRSLAKCLIEQELVYTEEQLDPELGIRERLTEQDVVVLAELVEQQQRLALQTLLHSLVRTPVMINALERFDRVGSGEMSLEDFRELAFEALVSQRKIFHAFQEEPKKSHGGFCLRHGFTEIYATDSVCILCATEYQGGKSPSELTELLEKCPDQPQFVTDTSAFDAIDAARRFSGEHSLSERSTSGDLNADSVTTRRASSPTTLQRLSSDEIIPQEVLVEANPTSVLRRRRAIAGMAGTSQQMVDGELETMLNRLHAAERTIVIGEAQPNERKASLAAVQTRQSCVSTITECPTISHTSSCSDLGSLTRNPDRNSTTGTVSSGPGKIANKKKRMKKKILKKTARRLRSTNPLPASVSLSKLLRMEFSDRNCVLATSVSESIIGKAVRIEQRRKELDRLVVAEVQGIKQRLAMLLEES